MSTTQQPQKSSSNVPLERSLCCPSCRRDFEVPRRYRIKEDDYDYTPIPRLLGCLHTVCHSCLEDQRERNDEGRITCPICKSEEVVKGIQFMPLDISVLKQVVRSNSAETMSVCARCYESVPSFSWCVTCSSALCEFHHQDHILSVDTSKKHEIHTFKEIRRKGLSIDYRFAPIACPEVLLQDCSIYCHDCLHLVSSQAMVENHKDHRVDDFKDMLAPAERTVRATAAQATANCRSLQQRIEFTQQQLQELDENEDSSAAEITRVFNMLLRKLKHREQELSARLKSVVQQKRKVLTSQLNSLAEMLQESTYAAELAAAVEEDTRESDSARMYLLAAAESLEFRTDSLTEAMEQELQQQQQQQLVNTAVAVHFVAEEALTFKALAKSFGGISYHDDSTTTAATAAAANDTAGASAESKQQQPQQQQQQQQPQQQSTAVVEDEADAEEAEDKFTALRSEQIDPPLLPKIRFCVQIKREQVAGKHHSNSSSNSSSSSQYIVVEARLIDQYPADSKGISPDNSSSSGNNAIDINIDSSIDSNISSSSVIEADSDEGINRSSSSSAITNSNSNSNNKPPLLQREISRLHPESVVAMNPAAGRLLGSVVLHTDIDRRLLNRHELRSYFESLEDGGRPVLKIVKEIVPAQNK